jgi:hypothetical protein
VFWSDQDGLDPETALTRAEPKEVTRDEFLAKVIMQAGGESVTVKDTILHTANVVGAVHPGRPREDVNRLLGRSPANSRSVATSRTSGRCRPLVALSSEGWHHCARPSSGRLAEASLLLAFPARLVFTVRGQR